VAPGCEYVLIFYQRRVYHRLYHWCVQLLDLKNMSEKRYRSCVKDIISELAYTGRYQGGKKKGRCISTLLR